MNGCLICNNEAFKKVGRLIDPRCIENRIEVNICRCCGHIQLNNRNTHLIKKDNDCFFDEKYNSLEYVKIEKRKTKILAKNISPYKNTLKKVLDVGAGAGWTAKYFMDNNIEYHAVEQVTSLRKKLLSEGASVAVENIKDIKTDEGDYDLIILRHVLEHLEQPVDMLLQIRNLLSDKGILYLAVPNFAGYNFRHPFLADFIRPVHLSYFTAGTLGNLLNVTGFQVLSEVTHGELLRILQKKNVSKLKDIHNFYSENRKQFAFFKRRSFLNDLFVLEKLKVKKLMK